MSDTVPMQCSTLRKGGYVVIKAHPCKIVELHTSSPGKHGHSKMRLTGLDMFTGKKHEELCPAKDNIEVPVVTKKNYQVLQIEEDGDCVSLFDKDTMTTRQDVRLPDDCIGQRIRERFTLSPEGMIVTVLSAMGQDRVVAFKQQN